MLDRGSSDAEDLPNGIVDPTTGTGRWHIITTTVTSSGSPLTIKGDIFGFSTVDARFPIGSEDQLLAVKASATFGFEWQTVDVNTLSPVTTKGDLEARSATALARLGIGTNGQVLTADSAEALGMKWAALVGDFAGPGSATDNAYVRFDLTTGKLGQNSITIEADSGEVTNRVDSATTTVEVTARKVNSKTSGDASNGHGGTDEYQIEDNAAGPNTLAEFAWIRDNGSDTTGKATWRISDAGSLEDRITMDKDGILLGGIITAPEQPAFSAFRSAASADITGDATVHTIIFDAEVFDTGGDYNIATGVFTNPVDGKIRLGWGVGLGDIANGTTHNQLFINIVTSNRTYLLNISDPSKYTNATLGDDAVWGGSVLADMDAGDTATVTVAVHGGTKIIDLLNSPTVMSTSFSGILEVA